MIDLLGQTFGRLTVVKRLGVVRRMTRWDCLCVCGNHTSRATGQLIQSRKKDRFTACRTCTQGRNRITTPGETTWQQLLLAYKAGARRRGLAFELSPEQFKQICSQVCTYCNEPPRNTNRYMYSDGSLKDSTILYSTAENAWIRANGLDRIDSSVGYHLENVCSCCSKCNRMKGTLTTTEFVEQCRKIAGCSK